MSEATGTELRPRYGGEFVKKIEPQRNFRSVDAGRDANGSVVVVLTKTVRSSKGGLCRT